MKTSVTRLLLTTCLLLTASHAHADERSAVRVTGGTTLGPKLTAWDVGYGMDWDTPVGGFGVRLGVDLGMLSYLSARTTPGYFVGTPELGVYVGGERDTRIYYTLQVPTRLLDLEARYRGQWFSGFFLGARLGAELEQRWNTINTRVRGGLFASVLRDEAGTPRLGVGIRLAFEYGPAMLPPPPQLDRSRYCPDGTPIFAGKPCS
jgi:hypothetical protein